MNALLSVLDEVRYRGLAAIALGAAIAISGVSALLVGGIWVTWRLWDWLGLPTQLAFTGVLRVGYWPAPLLLDAEARRNELAIALASFGGWFAALVLLLFLGRKIRQLQGKVLP